MKPFNKNVFKNVILYVVLIAVSGIAIFLVIPSNYYVRHALVHLMPKIDQYSIFENRVVKADNPHPWEFAPDVENKQIAPEFASDFKKY